MSFLYRLKKKKPLAVANGFHFGRGRIGFIFNKPHLVKMVHVFGNPSINATD